MAAAAAPLAPGVLTPPTIIQTKMDPVYFNMYNFWSHKACPEVCWFSRRFYTSENGYKLCIGVDANGSGVDNNGDPVSGKYTSVYVYLMSGRYDDYLWFPFRGEVKITLLNNDTGKEHLEKTICFTSDTDPKFCSRVSDSKRNEFGWGDPSFVAHNELYKYIENDCLRFTVEVTIT